MKPRISLLIPCYNASRFLPRLIANVRGMTEPFAAVLLYDDGSTDDTVAVARQLGLTILTGNTNAGVAHARNRLAAAANTEWLHFHDADDRIAFDFVEQLAPLLTDIDVASCDADWISEEDGSLEIAWRYDADALHSNAFVHLLSTPMGLNSSIIRRSTWLAVGGCDERLAMWEDADVHIRIARDGGRFRHLPTVLTWSLRRSESFSHDYRRNWMYRLAALERYVDHPTASSVPSVLASQAEDAARHLLMHGEEIGANRALQLCIQMGGRPPSSQNRLMNSLKWLISPMTLLKWQQRHRTSR